MEKRLEKGGVVVVLGEAAAACRLGKGTGKVVNLLHAAACKVLIITRLQKTTWTREWGWRQLGQEHTHKCIAFSSSHLDFDSAHFNIIANAATSIMTRLH